MILALSLLICFLGSCERKAEGTKLQIAIPTIKEVSVLNVKGSKVANSDVISQSQWACYLSSLKRIEEPKDKVALIGYLKVAVSSGAEKGISIFSDGYVQCEGRWYRGEDNKFIVDIIRENYKESARSAVPPPTECPN